MNSKLFTLLTILFLGMGLQLQAQNIFNDTILFSPADFIGDFGKIKGAKNGGILPKISAAKLTKISPAQAKKMKVPAPTKSGKGPIVLKFGDNCYQFGCAKGGECSDCRMFWWDRNKDGKVQPRRELRCFCPSGRSKCKIRVRKIPCKG